AVEIGPIPTAAAAAAPPPPRAEASIRVATTKVDRLMNLVGELVITQSMIQAAAGAEDLDRLHEAVAALERTSRELQEQVMAVRMVPVASVFQRMPRVVRDLGAALGKQVVLELQGEATELDKSGVEGLVDPLPHLRRNAVDPGVGPRAERRAAGKPESATVRLSASHRGGEVVIEVADDGRGLDPERIRRTAVARGLIAAGDDLNEAALDALIFRPGFSAP